MFYLGKSTCKTFDKFYFVISLYKFFEDKQNYKFYLSKVSNIKQTCQKKNKQHWKKQHDFWFIHYDWAFLTI